MAIFPTSSTPATGTALARAPSPPNPAKSDGGADGDATRWYNRRPAMLSFSGLSKRTAASHATPPATPPAVSSKQLGFPALGPGAGADGALPGAARVDPSRVSQFALRLSELLNKAFVAAQTTGDTPAASVTGTSPFTGATITVPRLANITYGISHVPVRAIVIEMTTVIITELQAAAAVDPYLLRAVSRTVLKAMSQFVSRIESLLVPVQRDASALAIPSSAKGAAHLSPALEFNLALMSVEWVVEESLERCLEGMPPLKLLTMQPTGPLEEPLPPLPPYCHEILSPLREQMEASILHVVQPVLLHIKSTIAKCVAKANPRPFEPQDAKQSASIPALDAASTDGSAAREPWLRELEERLDAAYRLLMLRMAERCGEDGRAWFISVAIHVIWKGLVTITARSVFAPASVVESEFAHTFGRTSGTTPSSVVLNSLLSGDLSNHRRVPTPTQLAHALRSVAKPSNRVRRLAGDATGTQTPQEACSEFDGWKAHFTLPCDDLDCFVVNPLLVAEQLHDLQVFERLVHQFCGALTGATRKRGRMSPRARKSADYEAPGRDSSDAEHMDAFLGSAPPSPGGESGAGAADDEDLAMAALREALSALQSTIVVLRTLLQEPDALQHLALHTGNSAERIDNMLSPAALHAFNVIPRLLLIQIAFCRIPPGWTGAERQDARRGDAGLGDGLLPTPAQLFGYTWEQYDAALTGFAAGEKAAASLAASYAPVLHRVYQAIDVHCEDANDAQNASSELVHETDALSVHSDASSTADADLPSAMTQSMPALGSPAPSRGATGTEGTAREGAAAAPALQLHLEPARDSSRSRTANRTALPASQRFWRRSPAQPQTRAFGIPNALPPRVSRAHATSSPFYGVGRTQTRSPSGQREGCALPRSSTHTLAHMQRNALNMFDSVLRRAQE
ncbi:hypothetical protein MSPP1_000814 [Malassezia sp. CBS 17886]|nr:hypothetical protein MSPP1_000814 [Malassezia sp. CBS 17886]